jgi:hypothetical protein
MLGGGLPKSGSRGVALHAGPLFIRWLDRWMDQRSVVQWHTLWAVVRSSLAKRKGLRHPGGCYASCAYQVRS